MAAETRESGDAARRLLTDDGRIVTGYGRREPRDSIEVCAIVAQAPVTLPTIAIQETLEAGRPMPEGMTHAEVRDLIRYLVELKPRYRGVPEEWRSRAGYLPRAGRRQ